MDRYDILTGKEPSEDLKSSEKIISSEESKSPNISESGLTPWPKNTYTSNIGIHGETGGIVGIGSTDAVNLIIDRNDAKMLYIPEFDYVASPSLMDRIRRKPSGLINKILSLFK